MPALLEHEPEQFEALEFAAAGSCPTLEPHNRHNPCHKTVTSLILVCATLIVVGIFWRAWQLDRVPGVNGDEAWYGVQSQRFLDEYLYQKTLPEAERVDFRTPTGNIWNPFLMIPRLVLDATLAPSIWSLRLPALVSGILTLLVNWWLCWRALDRKTAGLTTAVLSILPVAMIYSRLGWDASQSILYCLPLLYLPWISVREGWSAARTALYYGLAIFAALLVHPTNIFLLPLSAAFFWPRISAAATWELSLRSRVLLAGAAFGAAVFIGIARGAWTGVDFSNLSSALRQWSGDVIGLFNGATVYGSISLPATELPTASGWLWISSLPTIVLLIATRIECRTTFLPQKTQVSAQRYAMLFDGTCFALFCFLGVAGPAAIQPGYERYALWMVAPIALLIVLAYKSFARCSRETRVAVSILAIVQVVVLLSGYWQYYQRRFDVPAADQQLAHWTYRADNFADWTEIQKEFERSLVPGNAYEQKKLLVLLNDPQRWWFEWKWRYLSYGSGYEWILQPDAQALSCPDENKARWILFSQPESEKEKLSIRYLSN